MKRRQAAEQDFVWQDSELVHTPTGARFVFRPGTSEITLTLVGLLGARLGDGQDHDIESVMDLAWKLAEQRQLQRQ